GPLAHGKGVGASVGDAGKLYSRSRIQGAVRRKRIATGSPGDAHIRRKLIVDPSIVHVLRPRVRGANKDGHIEINCRKSGGIRPAWVCFEVSIAFVKHGAL